MQTLQEHDVRTLVPIKRHKKLIKMFKELPSDDSFIFINDHDPKPLYYEFRSIFGDVLGWEYLQQGGKEWKVKVTRTEPSKGKEFEGASTLMDLRKADKKEWKHIVFHRYGMMLEGDTMELIAKENPAEIKQIFANKFSTEHTWKYKKKEPGEYVIHITKKEEGDPAVEDTSIVNSFDVRSYQPAKRHEMVYDAFDALKPGEAFVFINDHDPKPLYYQMEAENNIPFKWEYLETMPREWKVKVMKLHEEA